MAYIFLIVLTFIFLLVTFTLILVLRLQKIYSRWKRRGTSQTGNSLVPSGAGVSKPSPAPRISKQGMVTHMIAHMEEFDSLTPLVTPGSFTDDQFISLQTSVQPEPPSCMSKSCFSSLGGGVSCSEASPPPPRRGPLGKTFLVPLAISRGRPARPTNLDDGVVTETSFSHTTKSITTIPEETFSMMNLHAQMESNQSSDNSPPTKGPFSADLDFVSIDRTSASTLEKDIQSGVFSDPIAASPGSMIPPFYHPPPPPNSMSAATFSNDTYTSLLSSSGPDMHANGTLIHGSTADAATMSQPITTTVSSLTAANIMNNTTAKFKPPKQSPSMDSMCSNLSSPLESSMGDSGSPLDTTSSMNDLSDSMYMASESDTTSDARGMTYYIDSGLNLRGFNNNYSGNGSDRSEEPDLSGALDSTDVPTGRRFLLHRIEEESEIEDDKVGFPHYNHQPVGQSIEKSKTDDSLSALSHDGGSVVDSEYNFLENRCKMEEDDNNVPLTAKNGGSEGLI